MLICPDTIAADESMLGLSIFVRVGDLKDDEDPDIIWNAELAVFRVGESQTLSLGSPSNTPSANR